MNARVSNTLGGRTRSAGLGTLMKPGIILALLLIGIVSFGALVTLSGFAGDMRGSKNGRAHAISKSAIGYNGIVQLLKGEDLQVDLKREADLDYGEKNRLRIFTLSHGFQGNEFEDMDVEGVSLIIPPKWSVEKLPGRRGWVRPNKFSKDPVLSKSRVNQVFKHLPGELKIGRTGWDDSRSYDVDAQLPIMPEAKDISIRYLQTFHQGKFDVLLRAKGAPVLVQLSDSQTYVLSDPDFLNNLGLSDRKHARLARDMLAAIAQNEGIGFDTVIFDLSLHGFDRKQNLIKTLLTPPFLAATLCLLAAFIMIGWQAYTRFGDPIETEMDYALGQYTLADNGARFIRIARKETGMAPGYEALMRRIAASPFGLERQSVEDIEEFFTRRENRRNIGHGWEKLKQRLHRAQGKEEFLSAAQDLHNWKQELIDEGK